ncbi:MAG: exo-alpha-sialidase, partial [Planctomycetes bacterium]|nr:exo-alpha-sialidase [Planctomycetota bacterium]
MKAKAVETLLLVEPSKANPRNSEGSIIELKDGRLFLAYSRFTGGGADNAPAQIAARVADHDGKAWSDDRILVDKEGVENVMSVSLLRLTSGEILMLYLLKNSWEDCRPYLRRSTDEMQTLSDRTLAIHDKGYFVVNNDRLVQLSSGRRVIPAALHPCKDGTFKTWDHRGIALCYLSDDGGRTWRRCRSALEAP